MVLEKKLYLLRDRLINMMKEWKKLYKIRPFRRITSEDMTEIWPEWSIDT